MMTTIKKRFKRSPVLMTNILLVFIIIVMLITLAMFTSFDEATNRFEAGRVDITLIEPAWKSGNGQKIVPNTFIDKNPAITNNLNTVYTDVFLEVTIPYEDDLSLIVEYAYQDTTNQNNAGKSQKTITSGEAVPYYKFIATREKTDGSNPVSFTGKLSDYSYNSSNLFTSAQNINPGWELLKDYPKLDTVNKTFTYVYAYVGKSKQLEALSPGVTTEYPLFNKVYMLNFREREKDNNNSTSTKFPDSNRDYSIKIRAYGIQANYLESGDSTTFDPEKVWKIIKPDNS